jgi:hypothetical protein
MNGHHFQAAKLGITKPGLQANWHFPRVEMCCLESDSKLFVKIALRIVEVGLTFCSR